MMKAKGECNFTFSIVSLLGSHTLLSRLSQIVTVNDPVELTCNVTGLVPSIDPPVVRWVHNAVDVIPGGRFYSPQPNVLRIHQAIVSDSGVYQCFVGRQQGGDVQDSAQLSVRDSPSRLTGVFNDKSVHPGRAVYLYCSASGSPPPTIVWTLDSFNVPYTSSGRSVLAPHYSKQQRAVVYKCQH